MEYELRYHCGGVAKEFHRDVKSRVKLLIGPFGTGKTSSAAFDLIELASKRVIGVGESGKEVRRSRFAVVRNTYPELRDTTIKTYLEWFPSGIFGQYNQTDKIYKIKYDNKEIEIIFKALDTPNDVRDLLSLELTGAHVDEAREIHHDVIKGLLGRVGRFPSMKDTGQDPFLTPPQILLTTNYPSREHWLYRDFVGNPVEGYKIYEQTQEENKHNLRKNYYEDLEKDYKDRPDLLKTLVRGEWGVTVKGRQVYQEFNRKIHVTSDDLLALARMGAEDGRQVIRGWDNTGLNPACVITYVNSLGQWFIMHEFCGEDIGIVDFGEMVKLWSAEIFHSKTKFRDIGDPAGKIRDSLKGSPRDYLRKECGIYIEPGLQNFKIRREAVAGRLTKMERGEPAMVVHSGCTRIIDGFEGGYAYPEIGKTGIFKAEPIKNEYSHIHDAMQYIATVLFKGGFIYYDDNDVDIKQFHRSGKSLVGGY